MATDVASLPADELKDEDDPVIDDGDGLVDEAALDELFGDDDDQVLESEKPARHLDDEELDSGDDEGRADRANEEEGDAAQYEEVERLAMDIEVQRQPLPEPSDGEMYLLKLPKFLSIEPQAWQTTTFQPPTTEHHSKQAPSETFSAFNTAVTTIRWRHSPSDSSQLQSNARINRWEDGTLTLQLASDPKVHYEFDCNLTAPPQRNPVKPTPTASVAQQFRKDQFTYLVVPVESAESLRVAHKVTAGLSLRNPQSNHDEAIQLLKLEMAQLAGIAKVAGVSGDMAATEEDPELGRKRAEVAERSAMRDRKRRENAQERERMRTDRAMGRAGLSSTRYGGLNVGMLEDEEMEEGAGRSQPSRARPKAPRRRRNSEYSDDEDFGHKRFTREDDYDQDDDFLAPSDEEEVVVDDDEDEDDGIIEEPRAGSPKRSRAQHGDDADADADDADADADEEPDDDVVQASRTKRRRVVDEDEDE